MFYFFRQDLFTESNSIEIVGHTAATAALPWIRGVRFDAPLPLETLELDPSYGSQYPDFFDTSVPVMSQALVDALLAFGVSNFDLYPVRLRNKDSGEVRLDYSAVNVIGAVDAVDLGASDYRLQFGAPYFTGRITIDTQRAGSLPMFRLADGPGFIVVNQALADRLRERRFRSVLLQPTIDYDGA